MEKNKIAAIFLIILVLLISINVLTYYTGSNPYIQIDHFSITKAEIAEKNDSLLITAQITVEVINTDGFRYAREPNCGYPQNLEIDVFNPTINNKSLSYGYIFFQCAQGGSSPTIISPGKIVITLKTAHFQFFPSENYFNFSYLDTISSNNLIRLDISSTNLLDYSFTLL